MTNRRPPNGPQGPMGPGGPGSIDLAGVPPGWFGLFEPRPYKGVTELLIVLGQVLQRGGEIRET